MLREDDRVEKLKQLLFSYTYIEFEIESINEEIINLGGVIDTQRCLSVSALTGMPRGNETSDTVYNSVEKILVTYGQEVARLETKLEKAFRKRNYIDVILSVLDPIEKRIIELKYFKKYKPWMIWTSINYEKSHYYRLHDKAIDKLLEVFDV